MDANNTALPEAGAAFSQAEIPVHHEDGQSTKSDRSTASGTSRNYQGENQVVTESVRNQYNYFREALLDLDNMLMSLDTKAGKVRWEHIKTEESHLDYEAKLNELLEKKIIFIVSDNNNYRRSLACHLANDKVLRLKERKEIFFNHTNEKKAFGIWDLVSKLDKEGLFIVGDLGQYNLKPFQNLFLNSLTNQLHTDIPARLNEKNSFIVLLITSNTAREKISTIENYQQYFAIWTIDDLQAAKLTSPDTEVFFAGLNPIQKVLLYVATFFKGVTFRIFDSIVDMLLAGSLDEEPIAMEQYKDFEEGARKVMLIQQGAKGRIWGTYRDKFLKSCHLTGKEEGGIYIVDFVYPDLAEECRRYFKEREHYFWQQQFSILEQNGLVFHRNDQVALKMMEIVMDAMQDDPSYYDNSWLWNMARSVKDFENAAIVAEENQRSLLLRFLDWIKRSDNAYFFYNRLGQILTQMLGRGMDERVNYFLSSLFEYGDPDVLLKLVQRLANVAGFDKFYWIEQLLEKADRAVKSDTYLWLLRYVSYYEKEKTWEVVGTWLPGDKPIKNYSPSNHYACLFIIHYYIEEIAFLPFEKYGQWPGEYPLFTTYEEDADKCKEHIRLVITMSLHEGTEYQFSGKNEAHLSAMTVAVFCLSWYRNTFIKDMAEEQEFTPTFFSLVADIIETWFFILRGNGTSYVQQAQVINDFIVKTLIEATSGNPDRLGKITKQWGKKVGIYRKEYDRIKTQYKENTAAWEDDDKEHVQHFLASIQQRRENLEYMFDAFTKHL